MAYGSFNAGPGKASDEDVVRTDQIGIPGGIATLDADGHLTESQRWEVDGYKKGRDRPAHQRSRGRSQRCRERPQRHPCQCGSYERQHQGH